MDSTLTSNTASSLQPAIEETTLWQTNFLLTVPGIAGLLVLIGWHLQLPALIQINPTFAPMQYNTALGFLLSSAAGTALNNKLLKLSRIAAGVLTILGAVTLSQYLFGIELGLDQLFMDAYITVATSHPGRMAPVTAASFTLFGLAILILGNQERIRIKPHFSSTLITLVFALGFIALTGYLIDVESAYGWGALAGMAVHTASAFVLLAIGVLLHIYNMFKRSDQFRLTILICAGAFSITLLVVSWLILTSEQERRINFLAEEQALLLQNEVMIRENTLQQVAMQILSLDDGTESTWVRIVELYQNFFKELESVIYVPSDSSASVFRANFTGAANRLGVEELLSRANQPPWEHNGNDYLSRQYTGEHGALLLVVSIDSYLAWLQQRIMSQDFVYDLRIHETPIIQSNHVFNVSTAVVEDKFGINWTFLVSPTQDTYRQQVSNEPLIISSLIAVLALAIFRILIQLFRSTDQSRQNRSLYSRLSNSLNAMTDAVVVINSSGIIDEVNRTTESLFGYPRKQLIGLNVKALMPESMASEHDGFLHDYVAGDASSTSIIGKKRVMKARRKDGAFFPIELRVTEYTDDNGNMMFTGVIHDLSKLASLEECLLEKESILNTAMKTSHACWAIIDLDGRFISVNPALERWLGYSEDEIKGMSVLDVYHPEDQGKQRQTLTKLLKDELDSASEERRYLNKEGKVLWGLWSASLVRNADGEPMNVVSQIIDITQRKQLEHQIRAQNLALEKSNAELDQFAYVASHDLKAPLNAINKLANWIEEDCQSILPAESMKHLELLQGRSIRLNTLLDDLLQYSQIGRSDNAEPSSFLLSKKVKGVIDLLELPPGITVISNDVELQLPSVPVELILRNLISNSIKHHDLETGEISVFAEERLNSYEIVVKDDGPGIPESLRDKAMEMFQTLRSRDDVEGSGMGLAICKKTLEYYGGSLEIVANRGRGTTIKIVWPRPSPPIREPYHETQSAVDHSLSH